MTLPREIFDEFALGPGGGDSAYERGGDARRKILIKTLKETDLDAAQAFFLTPKRDHFKTQTIIYFHIFSRATLNETLIGKIN